MRRARKSIQEAEEIACALRLRRKELGITLAEVAVAVQIDVGQLSRFERADFKFVSRNLQKLIDFLQIQVYEEAPERDRIVRQFAELLGRSERHKAVAIALVLALQELQ